MKKIRFENLTITFSWSNWTFGFWWDCRKMYACGVDLGPLEVVYYYPTRWKNNGMRIVRQRSS